MDVVPEVSMVGAVDKNLEEPWCLKWTPAELRSLQLGDSVIHPILAWRGTCSKPPPKEELQDLSKTVHNLCAHSDMLEV